ncbi:MAG: hypothetical protein WCA22_17440 [Candidatus Binatus sp.]
MAEADTSTKLPLKIGQAYLVFGAFIAGMMLGRSTRLRRRDRTELEAATIGVFAPIFFGTRASGWTCSRSTASDCSRLSLVRRSKIITKN